jgi:ketosteroid isomerase-like protein
MATKQETSTVRGSVDSTSVQDRNIASVRRGYDAFAAGDMATLTELFHPGAAWHVPAMGVFAGNYVGREAILAFFSQTYKEADGTFRAVPGVIAASGDRVFVQQRMTGKRQGRSLDSSAVVVFTLVDGQIREVDEYHGDYAASAAFWA